LLARWKFALALALNEIPGTQLDTAQLALAAGARTPAETFDRIGMLLLGATPPPAVRDQVLAALNTSHSDDATTAIIAAIVASPAYQWR
jgi:hypothetical protein